MSGRAIEASERSGVLAPQNLARFRAQWFEPHPELSNIVDSYWSVRWQLNSEEVVRQPILAAPGVTLSFESGNVPAPLIITGVYGRAWERDIAGSGTVFGVRLRPAGLAALSALRPRDIADSTIPVDTDLDPGLHHLMGSISPTQDPAELAIRVDDAIRAVTADYEIPALHLLANTVVSELTRRVRPIGGPELAGCVGASERSIQRALSQTIGHGPNWVARWVRLQEVVRLLSAPDAPPASELAATLGYTDQAHLVNDFHRATGTTPGAYMNVLRKLAA